jgi:alpha-L-rhamnosidase
MQPNTMRYLKVAALRGRCELRDVTLREYASDAAWEAQFACSDPDLNRIFEAARETYRQNGVDLFMDCPSRERAGWLCDSFFTARVAHALTGRTDDEQAFLENFLLPERFDPLLPEGMLPMCYPADALGGGFIPNWALWFVLQLEEYLARSGDRPLVDALRPRVTKLFEYFERFVNADGLLERLENWVFIEWSKANDFVQDVNFPSNMLFAAAMEATARLYDLPDFAARAQRVRATIREQSFRDGFFTDNAVRDRGALKATDNRTEVCQYYAFYFGTATPQSHPELWATLRDRFGPGRAARGAFPNVHPANAFIGAYLRLELLSREGASRQILSEMKPYFLPMAEQTGTLWENLTTQASCNHGFASHVAHTLYRDAVGLRRIDHVNKTVEVRFADCGLDWCEGRLPGPEGFVTLHWRRDRGRLRYRVDVPAGYRTAVTNDSGVEVISDYET